MCTRGTIGLLIALTFVPFQLAASEADLSGKITRVDTDTWQVDLTLIWTGEGPSDPLPTCTSRYEQYVANMYLGIEGPLGIPQGMDPDWGIPGENNILWFSASLGTNFSFLFVSTNPISNLTIRYDAGIDWDLELYTCDQQDPCPEPCRGGTFAGRSPGPSEVAFGRLYAELPQGIGESTVLRDVPVTATRQTWGRVKSLFMH